MEPVQPMDGSVKTIREISLVFGSVGATLVAGFLLGAHVAPGSESAPMLSAFLLAAALVLAWKGMGVLALLFAPFLLAGWILRRLRGGPPAPPGTKGERAIGRLFVLVYTGLGFLAGVGMGFHPSGWGLLASGALYGCVALLLGILMQRTVFLVGDG